MATNPLIFLHQAFENEHTLIIISIFAGDYSGRNESIVITYIFALNDGLSIASLHLICSS